MAKLVRLSPGVKVIVSEGAFLTSRGGIVARVGLRGGAIGDPDPDLVEVNLGNDTLLCSMRELRLPANLEEWLDA